MAETKGSNTYLRPDIGEAMTTDLGGAVLPFRDIDRTGERDGIVVQIKVLTADDGDGLRVMSAMENALRGLTVNGKPVALVLTRDNIEISYADQERIANIIAPLVLRRLGIRDGVGGGLLTGIR